MFVSGNYRAHLVQSIKELLNKGKIEPVVIPGGAAGHIEAAGVLWYKPMKDQLREMYNQWMDEGSHTPPREVICMDLH